MPMKKYALMILTCGALLACATNRDSGAIDDEVSLDEPIELLPQALGPYSRTITTSSERAQAYFTQGMQLRYAYNVDEAARSMVEARRLDPNCAMCYWGEAFALGSYLNGGMTDEAAPREVAQ